MQNTCMWILLLIYIPVTSDTTASYLINCWLVIIVISSFFYDIFIQRYICGVFSDRYHLVNTWEQLNLKSTPPEIKTCFPSNFKEIKRSKYVYKYLLIKELIIFLTSYDNKLQLC